MSLKRALLTSTRLNSILTRTLSSTASTLRPSCLNVAQPSSSLLLQRSLSPCSINLASSLANQAAADVKKRIDTIVKNKSVVLFIKGTSDQPRCGFSKAVVDIMNLHGVEFESHNVLDDESLRSGIKEYSNWPTIPQIFFKGEFIGGCDILLEMHRSGELVDELKKIGIKSKLDDEDTDGTTSSTTKK